MSQHFVQLVRIKTKEKTYIFPSHHKQNVVSQKFLCFDTDIFLERTLFSLCFHMFIVYLYPYIPPYYTQILCFAILSCTIQAKRKSRGRDNDTCLPLFPLFRIFHNKYNALMCVSCVFSSDRKQRTTTHYTTMMSFE